MSSWPYPALCAGLAIVLTADGLLIEGGPKRRAFNGAAAMSVLPRLLPLLDGQHTLPQLAATLALPVSQVRQAVSLLGRCDLLEDGPSGQTDADPETAASLSRHVNVTRVWRNSGALGAALADSAVLLVAPSQFADQIRDDLRGAGVGHIDGHSGPEPAAADVRSVASAPRSVVVLMDQIEDPGGPERLERVCRVERAALLRCAVRGERIEIGPLFFGDYTACYRCFRHGYESLARDFPARGLEPSPSGLDLETSRLAAGLVAAEVLALLGQLTAMRSFRALTVTSVPGLDSSRFVVVPEEACPVCGSRDVAPDGSAALADAYEWLVQARPSRLAPPARMVMPPGLESLETQRPQFSSSPSRPLPPPAVVPRPDGVVRPEPVTGPDGDAIDEAIIAGILLRVAGQRDPERADRWAPRGGNLASVEAYLVTEPSAFPDMPGSVHRYDDLGHRLTAIRRSAIPLAECLAGTGLAIPPVQLAIVLVGGVQRISQKYDAFAYRLAHLDAGCAAMQLAAVCQSYGLTVTFAASWDDRLPGLLDLYPGGEIITAVAGIHHPKDPSCP